MPPPFRPSGHASVIRQHGSSSLQENSDPLPDIVEVRSHDPRVKREGTCSPTLHRSAASRMSVWTVCAVDVERRSLLAV